MTTVGQWMTRSLHQVPRETPVRICLKIMRDNQIRHLPVTDVSGRMLGLISEYDILEACRAGDPLGWAIERLEPTRISTTANRPVADVLVQMLESSRDCVVIVNPIGNPNGLFTEKDAMRAALELVDDWPTVGEVMTGDELAAASPDRSCAEGLAHMAKYGIRHLLLLEDDGRMYGVVSHRDLAGRTGKIRPHVPRPVFIARPEQGLREPVETMQREGVGSLPIIQGERDPVGILTRRDVMQVLLGHLNDRRSP